MILNSKLLLWDYLIFSLAPMRAQQIDCLTVKITALFTKTVVTVQAALRTGPLAKTGTLAITTTMVCQDLIHMKIMTFNASALIIFGTTFGTIFGTHKLFSKKYTHAEVLIIQQLPHIIHTYSSFKIINLRHKNTKTPKIQHNYNI